MSSIIQLEIFLVYLTSMVEPIENYIIKNKMPLYLKQKKLTSINQIIKLKIKVKHLKIIMKFNMIKLIRQANYKNKLYY
jgi:hypothetical protein